MTEPGPDLGTGNRSFATRCTGTPLYRSHRHLEGFWIKSRRAESTRDQKQITSCGADNNANLIWVGTSGFLTSCPIQLTHLRHKRYLSPRLRYSRHKRLIFRLRMSWPGIPIDKARKFTSQLNCSTENEMFQMPEMKGGVGQTCLLHA